MFDSQTEVCTGQGWVSLSSFPVGIVPVVGLTREGGIRFLPLEVHREDPDPPLRVFRLVGQTADLLVSTDHLLTLAGGAEGQMVTQVSEQALTLHRGGSWQEGSAGELDEGWSWILGWFLARQGLLSGGMAVIHDQGREAGEVLSQRKVRFAHDFGRYRIPLEGPLHAILGRCHRYLSNTLPLDLVLSLPLSYLQQLWQGFWESARPAWKGEREVGEGLQLVGALLGQPLRLGALTTRLCECEIQEGEEVLVGFWQEAWGPFFRTCFPGASVLVRRGGKVSWGGLDTPRIEDGPSESALGVQSA